MDRKALDRIAHDFQIELYEVALARGKTDLEIMSELAELYSRVGRTAESLALDEQLVVREPTNATFHYNLACTCALMGDLDRGFAVLKQSLALGFDDVKLLLEDRDLKNLRGDPRWAKIESWVASQR